MFALSSTAPGDNELGDVSKHAPSAQAESSSLLKLRVDAKIQSQKNEKACITGEDIAQNAQCKHFLVVKYSTMNSLFIGIDKIMLQLRKQVFWIHNLRRLHPGELFNKKQKNKNKTTTTCHCTLSAISESANRFLFV